MSIQSKASLCTQCLCTFINKGPYIDMFVLIYIQTYLIIYKHVPFHKQICLHTNFCTSSCTNGSMLLGLSQSVKHVQTFLYATLCICLCINVPIYKNLFQFMDINKHLYIKCLCTFMRIHPCNQTSVDMLVQICVKKFSDTYVCASSCTKVPMQV